MTMRIAILMSMLLMCAARPVSMTSRDDKLSGSSSITNVFNASEDITLQPSFQKVGVLFDYDNKYDKYEKKCLASCFWDKCDDEYASFFLIRKRGGDNVKSSCSYSWMNFWKKNDCQKDVIVDKMMEDDTNINESKCYMQDPETSTFTKEIQYPVDNRTCVRTCKANEFYKECKAAGKTISNKVILVMEVKKGDSGRYSGHRCINPFLRYQSFVWPSECTQSGVVNDIMEHDTTGYTCNVDRPPGGL